MSLLSSCQSPNRKFVRDQIIFFFFLIAEIEKNSFPLGNSIEGTSLRRGGKEGTVKNWISLTRAIFWKIKGNK